jgi:hypothetical protein
METNQWIRDESTGGSTMLAKATARGRIVAGYFGTLPGGYEDILKGNPGDCTTEGCLDKNYITIQNTIFNGQFGPSLYVQRFVKGKSAILDAQLILTN